ncbi:MAG: chorismate synthase [Bacillota bacterium]
MLRYLTAGESHGPCLTAVIEGLPAGIPLTADDIDRYLARRQQGYGRGGRMLIEQDRVRFSAGIRGGLTLGGPVALTLENRDWANWSEIMDPGTGADVQAKVVTRPRPGHADLAGGIKYRHRDMRNILERASARETAARVAVGAVAIKLLLLLDIEMVAHVVQIGEACVEREIAWLEIVENTPTSPVFCADGNAGAEMMAVIDRAKHAGDSLGGVFEVVVRHLPVGLGSHVHWDRRLDGRLAGALMSIPAIKGVEIGSGFRGAALPGSQVHDEIRFDSQRGYYRPTNRAGGLEGGITNGEHLVIRAAMKPIPTLMKPLGSVDIQTKETFQAAVERSDVCAVPAASVVGQAAVAWELAQAVIEKFGGDHMEEIRERLIKYGEYIRQV